MPQRRTTVRAFLAALLLHLLLVAATWNYDMVGSSRPPLPEKTADVVEVVLLDESPPDAAVLPRTYTSVPESQEIPEPPANPDFLALRNSRAADMTPGGEANASPRAESTGDLSQVAISRDAGGSPGGVVVMPVPAEAAAEQGAAGDSGGAPGGVQPRPGSDPVLREGEDLVEGAEPAEPTHDGADGERPQTTAELADLLAQSFPSILERTQGRPGDRGFDYDQESVSLDAGDLIQFGDFALSTVEWDFAPWLERFKRDFLPNWIPPYAYTHLGVIDGVTVLKLVVQPNGSLSELTVIEEKGHESLHRASLAAMRATAPLAPLPSHFPDPKLVMTVKLIYSAR
ncbi:energy transducer TonB [bacterium]|nr:energy transducer TonB [bacterium]MBU1674870.1 energy transducer TonB [bacterium]